jgi:hypothetical protein
MARRLLVGTSVPFQYIARESRRRHAIRATKQRVWGRQPSTPGLGLWSVLHETFLRPQTNELGNWQYSSDVLLSIVKDLKRGFHKEQLEFDGLNQEDA